MGCALAYAAVCEKHVRGSCPGPQRVASAPALEVGKKRV